MRNPGRMEAEISPKTVRAVQRAVLEFFDARARTLPWRTSKDPYRIWISEVMLQQTRVETVIPYYERWLERFPDLERLATATADDVLHAWAGLGYYSRARNLHRAAAVVRERHAGTIPDNARELRTLPGVGTYTAGAIASIAYGERAAAVDGNVRRVLSRLLDQELPAAALQRAAERLVPGERPGDFNQGLMELGATVCVPRHPRCAHCPLFAPCRARSAGTQVLHPAPAARRDIPEHALVTLVLRSPDGVLLTRSDTGLLAGMWRFPAAPLEGDVSAAARTLIRRITGRRPGRILEHGSLSHAFTHRRERYHVVAATLRRARPILLADEHRWTAPDRLRELALPAAQRRIAQLALAS